jgi:hypothetical protein
MKNACELLHQKEADLARVRKEVYSLNIVARLLAEDDDRKNHDVAVESNQPIKKPSGSVTHTMLPQYASEATGSQSPSSAIAASRLTVLDVLKRNKVPR